MMGDLTLSFLVRTEDRRDMGWRGNVTISDVLSDQLIDLACQKIAADIKERYRAKPGLTIQS